MYNLAIARINEGWDKLYQDLISYNSKYGDAIDGEDSLKTAWENATEAVKDYAYNVEAALQGIKTEGSFGNIQTNRVNELINQMKANGQGWANATTQAEKDRYEAANEALAKQLSVELGRPVVKATMENGISIRLEAKSYMTYIQAARLPVLLLRMMPTKKMPLKQK